ncbi:MAG TPA: hypothetical protein VF177_19455 [Anaerolineae bacterium]
MGQRDNGEPFLAFTKEAIDFLDQKTVLAYYQEPLPSATDDRLADIVGRFMAATGQEREAFQSALSQENRSLFGIYGHRAATLSVRQQDPDKLLSGLVGDVIANYTIPDRRDVSLGLAIYHHCAGKLGLNPVEVFDQAADFANPSLARVLTQFGRRTDVNLRNFGWRELMTTEGVRYTFNFG